MKIYLATSWRNPFYEQLRGFLLAEKHEVYDFRDPAAAFKWSTIDPNYEYWTPQDYIKALKTPEAYRGFNRDAAAIDWCNLGILLLPCGRSAHLEAGVIVGQRKPLIIYLVPEPDGRIVPELMYKYADTRNLVTNIDELLAAIRRSEHD